MKTQVIAAAIAVMLCGFGPSGVSANQGILAIVNDKPITALDVRQRQKLLKAFGSNVTEKRALQSLIDDVVKEAEGRKAGIAIRDEIIDKQISEMSKGKPENFYGQFKSKGITKNAVRRYVGSQMLFSALYRKKNPDRQIGPTEEMIAKREKEIMAEYNGIMKKYNAAKNDPRRKPVQVYQLQEIFFPVDASDEASAGPLLQARAADTQVFMKRYKGCKSARTAADGIYNVKIGKTIEADGAKLPRELKAALDKVGPGRAFGPARSKGALQLIGFCGKRTVNPPKLPPPPKAPTRDQIAASLRGPAMDQAEEVFMESLRAESKVIIDYKDASLSQ